MITLMLTVSGSDWFHDLEDVRADLNPHTLSCINKKGFAEGCGPGYWYTSLTANFRLLKRNKQVSC